MPYAAPKACLTPGCPRLATRGFRCEVCRSEQTRARREREGTNSARGYGATWQRLRAMILAEEPLCRECAKEGRTELATDVDHITPIKQGGPNTRANLQPLCKMHHSRKTMSETRRGAGLA